jgi:arabinogalactan oligomer/maltooligosaccharide transport system substrate-binding protein
MKKIVSSLLCMVLIMAFFTGCGKKDAATDASVTPKTSGSEEAVVEETTEPTQEVSADPVNIKVWHDGDEAIMTTIQDKINETLASENISVTFEKRSGLTDQIKLYGNDASNGPDMYIYAHDSLGIYAEMGVLAPITDLISTDKMADLLPVTIEACTYQDTQYLLPIYFETLLFLYNKDLWEGDIPNTTEGLYEYMVAHTDEAAGTYAVVNQHSTAYNVAPIINGFGGYILNSDAQPGLEEQATIDAITYNSKFAKLQADGDYNTVTTLFNEGNAQAIIGGPWLIAGIKEAGINLGFKSLADFKLPNGNGLAPFTGVQGIGVMLHSVESKKAALTRVLEVIASPELGIDLANKSNCAPANSKSYEDATVAANEMVSAIRATAETAQPMPNIPQINVMWAPTETLLALVNKSGADVTETAKQCQEEALTAIADMQ